MLIGLSPLHAIIRAYYTKAAFFNVIIAWQLL